MNKLKKLIQFKIDVANNMLREGLSIPDFNELKVKIQAWQEILDSITQTEKIDPNFFGEQCR